ncbi:MAG: hypothetical protein COS45_00550 [Candidatus Huberarchaeum crystalense]|uniref:Uncharacterized protein n=1 Tax=Huberarchaeum crystalense TaxID=2014257 RepID=A0A2H9M2L5_HUBC1|nr:MAG: hypothetical protein COS45_00550 [Candidatus Huberarchaeum crystalense]
MIKVVPIITQLYFINPTAGYSFLIFMCQTSVEKKNQIVKKDGKVRFKGRNYHISKKLKGTTVEMRVTLKGIEAKYGEKLIKRWKYWKYVPTNDVGYMSEKHLL